MNGLNSTMIGVLGMPLHCMTYVGRGTVMEPNY